MGYCDFGVLEHGQYDFIKCTIDEKSCAFQRWCVTDRCLKHTSNFTSCVSRRKKMEQEREKSEKIIADAGIQKKKEPGKKKYKVVVACDRFVIYVGEDGQNVRLVGDYSKFKAGDYLEL